MGRGSERAARWPVPGSTGPAPAVAPAPRRRRALSGRLWMAARLVALMLLLLAAAAGVTLWRLGATDTNYPGAHFNVGANAVWLEHSWAGADHTAGEYAALAAQLQREQIAYVYAHVGPLDSDGTIPADRAPYAARLAAQLHARLPGVRVLAWIGQVEIAGGYPAEESVDLGDSTVRRQIAATAAHFAADLGFDGVHYDIEPIINNNPRFLDLLDETRAALPAGAMLSITAEKWAPNAHVADWLKSKGKAGAWWTTYYYTEVAKHCDQMVSTLYDTAMPTAGLYELFVKQETQHILEAVRGVAHPPRVLIGVPTYTGDSFWFHDSAENAGTGLHGVIDGLNSVPDHAPFAGVAIYRYATTTDASWQTYERLWLGR